MQVYIVIACAVMVFMLGLGVSKAFDWDLEPRIVGICTAVWSAVAIYLFIFQWLTIREPSLYSLIAITLLSTAGYIVGQTIASLLRRDWMDELIPKHEPAAEVAIAVRPHRRRTANVIQLEAQQT